MILQRLMLPASVAFLVVIGIWINLMLKDVSSQIPLDADSPDYIIRNVRVIELNADGVAKRTLDSPEMRHFTQRGLSEVDTPLIKIFGGEGDNWTITGESGRVLEATDEVFLDGEVRINRLAAPGFEPVTITTRDLKIRHKENYAETAQLTSIKTPGHQIQGMGSQTWLNTPARVKLLAKVQSQHDFQKNP